MEKGERIVNISALFKNILKKWRGALICALLFALFGGAYRMMRLLPQVGNGEEPQDTEVKEEGSADFSAEYALIQENLVQKNRYLEESLKVKINPTAEGRAIMDLSIITPEMEQLTAIGQENPEEISTGDSETVEQALSSAANARAFRILKYYENVVLSGLSDWGTLPEEMGTKPQYLSELVSVFSENDVSVSVNFLAISSDPDQAEKIMLEVKKNILAAEEEAQQIYGPHKLLTGSIQKGVITDKALYTWMKDRVQEINDLTTQRDNLVKNSGGAVTSTKSGKKALSMKKAVSSSLKYAVAGFVAGLILYVVAVALILILSNRVLSARELNSQYGINKLACVPGVSKAGLDRLAAKIDGSYLSAVNEDSALKIAAENVRCLLSEKQEVKSIALIGDLSETEMRQLCEKLSLSSESGQVKYLNASGLNNKVEALRSLKEADAVILAARSGKSVYQNVNEILRTAVTFDKELLGSIVYEA